MVLALAGFFNIPGWDVFSDFLSVQLTRPFDTELLHWQWISTMVCLLACLNPWLIPARWLRGTRVWFHRVAQKRARAIWVCMAMPIAVRVLLLQLVPFQPPSVHDEFSLLLLADTLEAGRLSNPTPPYWQHFETVHVIQKPTYNSMYPPGFAVFLAVGQAVGSPRLGVLLTVGLMSGALCWMMQAWLPSAWAMGGTLLAVAQTGIGSFWMNSYVGGATVPVMAGALLLGAVPRFLKRPSWKTAALFAAGVVFLVNTRPFEGTLFSLFCFWLAVAWWWREGGRRKAFRWSSLAPAVLILVAGAGFTLYDSWRVTGNPFKTAYVVNRETYGWPENLAILPPLHLTYRHAILSNVEELEVSRRERYRTLGRMLDSWGARAYILWQFYAGPALTLLLLLLTWVLRNRRLRELFYIWVAMLSLNALQLMAYPQHIAAQACIYFLLLTVAMRHLYVAAQRRGFPPERIMAGFVLAVAVCAGLNLGMEQLHIRAGSFWEWPHWDFRDSRASIEAKLQAMPGKHLILVRYADNHSMHEEWVYNPADMEKSKVIWANVMNWKSDMEMRNYFRGRQAWIVEPDRDPNGFLPLTRKTYFHKDATQKQSSSLSSE